MTESDDLITLRTCETEFEAHNLAAILADQGIEAAAFGTASAGIGISLPKGGLGAVVQVRRVDLDRAKAALAQNVSDSVDLDWDEVDVGDIEDDGPGASGTMPMPARFAFTLAIILMAIALVASILTILL